jgi:hypothetical protein
MTESNNPDHMSQFKGSPLAEAMGQHVSSRHEFYREYVTQDHGHVHLTIISEEVALTLIEKSPYRPFLTDYMLRTSNGYSEAKSLMNKGAVRLTPSNWDGNTPSVLDDLGRRHRRENYHFSDSRMELWVYCADDNYWLTTPSKICFKEDHWGK